MGDYGGGEIVARLGECVAVGCDGNGLHAVSEGDGLGSGDSGDRVVAFGVGDGVRCCCYRGRVPSMGLGDAAGHHIDGDALFNGRDRDGGLVRAVGETCISGTDNFLVVLLIGARVLARCKVAVSDDMEVIVTGDGTQLGSALVDPVHDGHERDFLEGGGHITAAGFGVVIGLRDEEDGA